MTADTLVILRIELLHTEPLVWRRVAVRGTTSLAALHKIIQAAMGWLDYHLWEFEVEGATYGLPDPDGMDWGRTIKRASTIKLQKLLDAGVETFGYVYDMGDNWEHQIIIERVEGAQPDQPYPQFLGGERRCPPEDCGGIPGYYEFLDDIAGPDKGRGSKKKKEALDWYGGPYDPDDIDEEQIRITLKRIANASRMKKAVNP
ncbi:plasmid pRiA4b ORF-3 family protein [Nitrospirillum pindoramense]|uniref:PRiA4b ORF-3-like protein n=1 Tax=Nitrospirillum amazonense TaxID=28077 RepID=A0A560GYA1_9PROT|nr:plasmid pRiA4b ORF-3 family protein [Nitrospirillum amazonense]TWB39007.1 pRiA4b ORF-3-like protein [Nitrospirillum amazonense]